MKPSNPGNPTAAIEYLLPMASAHGDCGSIASAGDTETGTKLPSAGLETIIDISDTMVGPDSVPDRAHVIAIESLESKHAGPASIVNGNFY